MATISLYQNTGFNLVDIPESLDLVKSDANLYRRYTDGNVIQAQGLSNVIVDNITSVDAASIDFIIVRDDDGLEVGYNILSNFQFVAPRTCQFNITEAALTTILENMIVVSASANRMHVEVDDDDTTFYGNLEPFTPALSYVIGTSPIDDRFPIKNPACTNLLETVVAPPEEYAMPSNKDADNGYNITQKVYNSNQSFGSGTTIKQKSTPPVVTTFTDAQGNVLSKSALSTVSPDFRTPLQTVYTIKELFEGQAAIYTGSNYWCNGAQEVVNRLTAQGVANGITNYWAVPTAYIESIVDSGYSTTGAAGGISQITSGIFNKTVPLNGPTMGAFHNNKMYYGQALSITIFNPISGASLLKQVYEIRDENQYPGDVIEGSYSIGADIRPEGSPIFAWKCSNGLPLIGFPETLEGGNWRRIPISADTYNGSDWDKRNLQMQRNLLNTTKRQAAEAAGEKPPIFGADNIIAREKSMSEQIGNISKVILGTAGALGSVAAGVASGGAASPLAGAGALGGIGTGVNGITGLFSGGATYGVSTRALNLQEQELNAKASIATPLLTVSTSNYLRELGYNSFYWMVTSYSQEDLHAFDTFLTKYGYNVGSKAFAKSDFYSRPYFNYVRLNNIIMKTPDFSMYLRNIAEQELMRGVRVWHELPNLEAIEDGNKD